MITRPSTPQLIDGVIRGLEREFSALLSDETAQVRLQMLFATLRHCASRADHEIELMTQEAEAYRQFAKDVAERAEDAGLQDRLGEAGPATSMSLGSVSEAYNRAGDAFGAAMEIVWARGWSADMAVAEDLLRQRVANECRMTQPVGVGR
jgi:hypothetical protein